MKTFGFFILSLLILAFASGCGDKTCTEDSRSIEQYITDNNLTVSEGMEGLKYIILEEGGVERPSPTATVIVNYTGTLTNDEVFDGTPASGQAPIRFALNRLIRGWQLGIPLVGRGGRVQLFIPSALGYGSAGSPPTICPDVDLIFEIVLVNFIE